MRALFDPKELEPTGHKHPVVPSSKFQSDKVYDPVLNTPITPRENFRLLLQGKKPYWIPKWGLFKSDIHEVRPRINPDNVADRQFFDGGPVPDYASLPVIQKGLFGIAWEYSVEAGGATVHPGHPLVTDINKWRDQVELPDLNKWDWDSFCRKSAEYMNTSKYLILGILYSFWERLMALMDVQEACIALIDDDQKEGVKDFFDWFADFQIAYIDRVADCFPQLDGVLVHDDWAHKKGPFFSPDTAREMIAPYTKRIIDHCHSRGLTYEIHCCGNCSQLVPVFIEMGADMWGGQESTNDFTVYARQYRDKPFVFCLSAPDFPQNTTKEDIDRAAREWVETYKDCHIALRMMDLGTGKPADPRFVDAVYKYSRIAFTSDNQ